MRIQAMHIAIVGWIWQDGRVAVGLSEPVRRAPMPLQPHACSRGQHRSQEQSLRMKPTPVRKEWRRGGHHQHDRVW